MGTSARSWAATALAWAAYAGCLPLAFGGPDGPWPTLLLVPPSLLLGLLVTARRPASVVGPTLSWVGAAAVVAWTLEDRGGPLLSPGAWVVQLSGFVVLCLVFPDGPLSGRLWRAAPWLFATACLLVMAVLALGTTAVDDGADGLPPLPWLVASAVAGLSLLGSLAVAVAAVVARYRRGGERTRSQLRWLMLGAGAVPVLLAVGWLLEWLGSSVNVAYLGFVVALLVVLPATVAVAVLRYDLLDIDRLLTATVAWLVTSLVAAAVFAVAVLGLAELVGLAAGGRTTLLVATFAAALVLLPVHGAVFRGVGRLVDRDRIVTEALLSGFVRDVRDGREPPESVESVLRTALGDGALRVLVHAPGSTAYVDLAGRPADPPSATARSVPLLAHDSEVGLVVLGRDTARQQRRAREAAALVRLPIEVSRLRLELQAALRDARASRARLVEAVTEERRRLERDLHDGAQQRILAVGMRLRSAQRGLAADDPAYADLDAAVTDLEATVADLRRLAHGVRPARLDDGLDVAIRQLAGSSPIPVAVEVPPVELSEPLATTAYFVVAESLANTLKHAGAGAAWVTVAQCAGELTVEVGDDGCGGAAPGGGLTALGDRVAALGGRLAVTSPVGGGTVVRAEL